MSAVSAGVLGIALAYFLGPAGRGRYQEVFVIASTASLVLLAGASDALTHFIARERKGGRVGLTVASLLAALSTILIAAHPVFSVGLALMAVALLRAVLLGERRYRAVLVFQVAVSAASIATTLVVAALLDSAAAAARAFALSVGIVCLMSSVASYGSSTLGLPTGYLYRRYAVKAWPGLVAGALLLRLDQLLLSALDLHYLLGLYAITTQAYDATLWVPNSYSGVVFAEVSHAPSSRKEVKTAIRHNLIIQSALALLASVILLILISTLLLEFREAIPAMAPLLIASLFLGTGRIYAAALNGSGRPGASSKASIAALTLNVLLIYPLLQLWGLVGVGFSSAVSYAAFWFLTQRALSSKHS